MSPARIISIRKSCSSRSGFLSPCETHSSMSRRATAKPFEEFFTDEESGDWTRFAEMGVVTNHHLVEPAVAG